MMILIAFATVEGQTASIARFTDRHCRAKGHDVSVVDVGDEAAEVSFDGIDKVVLAGSVHERRHPKPFEVFIAAQREALSRVPSLLLSVSLKAAFPDGVSEARDYVTEMAMRTEFTPSCDALVAGAVRPAAYDYFASQVLQHVILEGQTIDPHKGHEFTDWDALALTLDDFLADAG